ncbi:MAG: hypothetical protein ACRCWB_09515 [Enterovibrio sp.]
MNIRPTPGQKAAAATGAPDGNDGDKNGKKMGISGVSSSVEAPQTATPAGVEGGASASTSGADGATTAPQPATSEQQDATQTKAEANTGKGSLSPVLQKALFGGAAAQKRRAPEPPTAQQNQGAAAGAEQTSATTSQSGPRSPSLPGTQGVFDLKNELGKLIAEPKTTLILNPSSQTGQKQTASAPSSPTGSRKSAAAEQEPTKSSSSAPASPKAGRKAKQVVAGFLKRLAPQSSSGPKANMAKTTGAASPTPSQRSATPPPRPPTPKFGGAKAPAASPQQPAAAPPFPPAATAQRSAIPPTPPPKPTVYPTVGAAGPAQAAAEPSLVAPPGIPEYLTFTYSAEGVMQLVPHNPASALRVNSLIVKTDPQTGRSRLMIARATGLLEQATSDEARTGDCAGLWPVDAGGQIVIVNISGNGEINFPTPPAGAPGGPSNV